MHCQIEMNNMVSRNQRYYCVDTDAAKVVQQLDGDQYKNSTVPLSERFWSSKVVELVNDYLKQVFHIFQHLLLVFYEISSEVSNLRSADRLQPGNQKSKNQR